MPSKSCIYCKSATFGVQLLGGVLLMATFVCMEWVKTLVWNRNKVGIFLTFKKCNKKVQNSLFVDPNILKEFILKWRARYRMFNLSVVGSWLIPILIYCKLSFMGEAQCLTRWSIQTFTQRILSKKMHPKPNPKFLLQLCFYLDEKFWF